MSVPGVESVIEAHTHRTRLGCEGESAMRAVSVHQPWAWAILHAGKVFENRSWRTTHRGPLVIHAAKSDRLLVSLDPTAWQEKYGVELPDRSQLPFGALVGVVEVVDCVQVEEIALDHPGRRWVEGPWCWVLADIEPLREPVACRGDQGLWTPTEWVADTVMSQLKRRKHHVPDGEIYHPDLDC